MTRQPEGPAPGLAISAVHGGPCHAPCRVFTLVRLSTPPQPTVSAPVRCTTLAALTARGSGVVAVTTPAGRSEYALPVHATDEVRTYWRTQTSRPYEAGLLAGVPGGRVYGAGIVLSADGKELARDVSPDHGRAPDDHWLLHTGALRAPRPLAGTAGVVATTLGAGYGHWLLDEVPRWLSLPLAGLDTVIAHAETDAQRALLAARGWTGRVLAPRRHSHWQAGSLVVPTLVGEVGYPTAQTVALLCSWGEATAPSRPAGPERIYISRTRALRRRVANEAALWPELERRGFVRVWLEDRPWVEQVACFRAARCVVAPHGAGLANVVFCTAGTRVVEFFQRSFVNGVYWRLSALAGLDYRPVVPAGAEPLAEQPRENRRDLAADLPAILRAVEGP